MQQSSLDKIVELARKVQTPEGAARYGQPVGSVISADESPADEKRPVTIERLRSIKDQLETAARTGDTSAVNSLRAQFQRALSEFSKGRTAASVLAELKGPEKKKTGKK